MRDTSHVTRSRLSRCDDLPHEMNSFGKTTIGNARAILSSRRAPGGFPRPERHREHVYPCTRYFMARPIRLSLFALLRRRAYHHYRERATDMFPQDAFFSKNTRNLGDLSSALGSSSIKRRYSVASRSPRGTGDVIDARRKNREHEDKSNTVQRARGGGDEGKRKKKRFAER